MTQRTKDEIYSNLESIIEECDAAFFSKLAALVPEATGGDFSPEGTVRFAIAARLAVGEWLTFNVPEEWEGK